MVPAQSARAIAAALLLAAPAAAQLQPEVRAELVSARRIHGELGAGVTWRAATYLRAGLLVAHDVWRSPDSTSSAPRGEFALRFSMDPIAQQVWGFSIGGGIGYHLGAYLLAVAELEGPRQAGLRPAFQLMLGGGTRFALVLRRASARGR